MNYTFRQATLAETGQIWAILEGAIARRRADGSQQWQDGYPNPDIVNSDIERGCGFVLLHDDTIIGYTAIMINDEPEYARIEGKWLTNGDFVVLHRVAIAEAWLGKGLATKIINFVEDYALSQNIRSVKADTNFDNLPMLHLFNKLGYTYCGEVYFRGSARKAFEKVLTAHNA